MPVADADVAPARDIACLGQMGFRKVRRDYNCAGPTGSRHCTLPPANHTDVPGPGNRASTRPRYAASACNPISFPFSCLYYMRKVRLLQAAFCTILQKLFVYFQLFQRIVHNGVAFVRVTRTVPPTLPAWCLPRRETLPTPNIPRCGRRHI